MYAGVEITETISFDNETLRLLFVKFVCGILLSVFKLKFAH